MIFKKTHINRSNKPKTNTEFRSLYYQIRCPISPLWGISLSASRQRQLYSSDTAGKKRKSEIVTWQSQCGEQRDSSSFIFIIIIIMWTLILTALLPSVVLSYEVDTKKLNGLAKARVEVRKAFHSVSVSGRMCSEIFGL